MIRVFHFLGLLTHAVTLHPDLDLCRLRKKLAVYKGCDGTLANLGVPPGSADLTLKVKDVDPRHVPKGLADSDDAPSAEPDEDRKAPHLRIKV